MEKSKFLEIFETLSKVEQNRFKKWVHSPYHNQQERLKTLLDYFLKEKKYSLEGAYKAAFPKEEFKAQQLRNNLSYLQKLLEDFLLHETMEQAPTLKQNLLLSIYRTRGASKGFQATARKQSLTLEKEPYRNIAYYYSEYRLQEEQYLFLQQQKRLESKNLQEVLNSLDTYYLANKLKYCMAALTHQQVFSTHYQLNYVQEVLKQVEEGDWLHIPTIAVYYYSYQALIDNKNIAACQALKRTFLEHWDLFELEELKDFYLITINFFIKQLNRGDLSFAEEVFGLYQSGLERSVFVQQGHLSRFTYKNIVAIGIKCEAYDWVEQFIEAYTPYLLRIHQTTYKAYNQAKLYYQIKAYKKAMLCLQTLEPYDRELVIDSKVTLMKIYYELEEYNALEALLESFHVYIKRNKELSAYLQTSYATLIRYFKKLQQYNIYEATARLALQKAIKEEPQLPERRWLLEQLAKTS
ncbi:MAG: hypothetical protein ACRBFS_22055 [Aureispira sp.]